MFDSGASIGCCCFVYVAVMITSMVLFSQAYSTVDVGNFAILQNKFSKKFDNEIYYSGRYYTGIAKTYITYPLKYQTITFTNRKGGDSGPISSTTSSGSQITVSCLIQYRLRPERIFDLYFKWPNMDRLKSDMRLTIKQIVSSLINQYQPNDFRSNRGEINSKMSFQIGNALKNQFYCDLNIFTISEVILADKDLTAYLNAQLTAQGVILQQQVALVNQKQAAIEGVVASTQQDVATINAQALATSTATALAAIAAADTDYVAGVKASLDTLKTTVTSFADSGADQAAKDKAFATFMYYSNLFSNRTSGTIVLGYD